MSACFVRGAAVAVAVLLLSSCGNDRSPRSEGPLAPPAIPDAEHGPSVPGDIDGDGVPNADDNCPSVANADQRRACEYPPRPGTTGDVVTDGLSRLNWNRLIVGLEPVTEDPVLSHGCEVHLLYLQQLAAELRVPQLSHTEDLSKPYASDEGNRAGVDSVLSLGQSDIASAVDAWMNTLYHRLPLIHPGLERVGIAFLGNLACVQYRPGTDGSVRAPYPILWPPPDIVGTDRRFGGNESPCPTVDNPLGGGDCPGSAAIPSLGINRWGRLADVAGTLRNLDTGVDVPLFHVWYDGGPSEHEQAGYVEGTVALVPQPGSSLERALYEVTVDGAVAGAAQSFRWRFRTARDLPTVGCDDLGIHRTLSDAYPIETGMVEGRICDYADMYELTGTGTRTVRVLLDHAEGDLDLVALDPMAMDIGRSEGTNDIEQLTVEAGNFVQVYGFNGAMGPYVLAVE